jgi:two-component system chemotaxis sensor kinase CheA
VSDSIRAQLMAAYADEHRDHLAGLRMAVAAGDAADFEEAYRHAHSLKGAARAVDLPAVVGLAHALESLLEAWWEGRVSPDEDIRRRAKRALDAIEDLSALALEGQPVPDDHVIQGELDEGLRRLGVALPEPPMPHAPRPAGAPAAVQAATLRVEAEAASRLATTTGSLLTELERQREVDHMLVRLGDDLSALVQEARHAQPSLRAALSALLAVHADVMRERAEREWALARAALALKEDVNRLRTVAAEGPLGGFGPMVRELAAEEGKQIRFEVEGLTALADRDVLSALGEAVLHVLRNAVHHGLEPPAERWAAGKDPEGRLSLNVAAQGARLLVRVADDGRGIDARRVGLAAAERGLIDRSQVDAADPDRLRQLIFEPGFSTAESITTTAGRGMGMPIVRQVVNRLQGSIELLSEPGRGTEIILSVPVTLLAQRIVLTRARGQVFGLPAASLGRLVGVAPDELVKVGGQVLATIDGCETPLADLGTLLGLPGKTEMGDTLCVAVLRDSTTRLGVVVDGFRDVRDLPVAALDPPLSADSRLAGTVVLEDGTLALVLSPGGLAVHAAMPTSGMFAATPAQAKVPLVLVVDDSITTRTLERSILETHGYRVVLAVDGRDALDRMAEAPPDVIVSDIEMPRLDGFGLLATVRGDPRLKSIPLVLVSSRDAPGDRQRGLALGADAYIVKTRFDQEDLLRTIGRLTA